MTRIPYSVSIMIGMLLVGGSGCGEATVEEPAATPPGVANEHGAPPPSAAGVVALTPDTLDAFERGLRKEIEAVRAAQKRSTAATTPQERGLAAQEAFEHATIPQGAAAAGLPVEQYREIRETVNGVFRTLDFQEKINGPMSIDLARADAATKDRMARDPFDELSSSSASALRAYMDRLVPVWIEYVTLTAVAG